MSILRTKAPAAPLLLMLFLVSLAGVTHAEDSAEPVYGVHNFELGEGADAAKFEKYVVEKFAPVWKEPRNGMSMVIMKGDRGERKDKYQLVYVFDSVKTRDKFFPSETGQPSELFQKTMDPVREVMQGLAEFNIQRKSFTDYVRIGDYAPPKPGLTPSVAVRNIELSADVDPEKFQKFLKDKFAPYWKEPRSGFQFVFTRGDRGERKGKFQFVWVFESIEKRNEFFPQEGGEGTGKLAEIVESAGEVMGGLQQFPFRGESYTDYYPLTAKADK